MSRKSDYAQWLTDNEEFKQNSDPEKAAKFDKIAQAYKMSGGNANESKNAIAPSVIPIFNQARESGFLKGYMDQVAGISQLVEQFSRPGLEDAQLIQAGIKPFSTSEFIDREEAAYQAKRRETGDTGIDWSRMAGNIINPVSIGTMAVGGPASSATMIQKVRASAAAGGRIMATHPVINAGDDFKKRKSLQIGLGAVTGGVIPPAVQTLKGSFDLVKYLARPFSQAGQMKDLKSVYIGLAGDARDKIITSLESATTRIKGNTPTAGQAIAEGSMQLGDDGLRANFGGSIVKIEQDLAKRANTGDSLKTIYGQQAQRRSNEIKNLIDSGDDALTQAIENRAAATSPFYKLVEVSQKSVNISPVLNVLKKHQIINKNQDSIIIPLKSIRDKMVIDGEREASPQALHSLSKNISNMMSRKTPGGQNEFDVKVLSDIKQSLDLQIGKAEPAYNTARKMHQEYSKPVNQINVSRELGNALENSVKEESPLPFLKAIADAPKILKKSTGFARYKELGDVMNKEQVKQINEVKQELLRQARTKELASKTESTLPVISAETEPGLPNLLSRPAMMANFVLKKIGKDMGPKYEKLAAKIQESPKEMAAILRLPDDNPKKKAVLEIINRLNNMIPSQALIPEIEREF